MTRLTKKLRLPNVTAYILTGICIGPYCADLIPMPVIDNMDFLSDIALAFIAFGTGEFFRFSTLRRSGLRVVVITVLEACTASLAVLLVTYGLLGIDLSFSLVLAALAAATAPASTMMTIRQTGARGEFVDTLLQVVALDDAVGLVAYSAAISFGALHPHRGRAGCRRAAEADRGQCGGFPAGWPLRPAASAAHAEGALGRQPADHLGVDAVCLLRHLRPAGCVAAAGLHVDGHGLSQHLRRRKALPAAGLFYTAGFAAVLCAVGAGLPVGRAGEQRGDAGRGAAVDGGGALLFRADSR